MRISDWSSDVCSSDLRIALLPIFNLQWAENCGIPLSMFARCDDTQRWTLVAVTALVEVAVAFWMTRDKAQGDVLAMAMIHGGAIENGRASFRDSVCQSV